MLASILKVFSGYRGNLHELLCYVLPCRIQKLDYILLLEEPSNLLTCFSSFQILKHRVQVVCAVKPFMLPQLVIALAAYMQSYLLIWIEGLYFLSSIRFYHSIYAQIFKL